MALDDPLQWVVIAVVVVVFLMWGPKKIPELARSLGLARKEFAEASKSGTTSPTSPVAPVAASVAKSQPPVSSSESDGLIDTARRLGLPTEGKTREEISQEILQLAQR